MRREGIQQRGGGVVVGIAAAEHAIIGFSRSQRNLKQHSDRLVDGNGWVDRVFHDTELPHVCAQRDDSHLAHRLNGDGRLGSAIGRAGRRPGRNGEHEGGEDRRLLSDGVSEQRGELPLVLKVGMITKELQARGRPKEALSHETVILRDPLHSRRIHPALDELLAQPCPER